MKRVNVQVADDVDLREALDAVVQVVDLGRISSHDRCFCYATTFKSGLAVYASVTKAGSDSFTVVKDVGHTISAVKELA